MDRMISLILVVALGALGWMLYQTQNQLTASQEQVQVLQQSLAMTQEEVGSLQEQVAKLDRTSIQGMVREANDAILDGWESMVKSIGGEVKKARENMEQSLSKDDSAQAPGAGEPTLESPDGTNRI